ncbi:hypothetical protein BYT27DRAFT_7194973 [Phlegmacium glaucopus]|nr:hypothetical protein BYT27DRAFT_7194973 [Phlegmacium glaucopus]
MASFHVPGWSMNTAPVSEQSSRLSKKRKRPSHRSITLDSAEINFEKLVATLKDVKPDGNITSRSADISEKKQKKKRRISEDIRHNATPSTNQKPVSSLPILKNSSETPPKPHKRKQDNISGISASLEPRNPSDSRLTALQKNMKQNLNGARFRLINENLYKSDSYEAHKTMQDDPQIFEEYHIGFRHQVLSWPTNPVEHYITKLGSYASKTFIADLGCGDAALARDLLPKGLSVVSFDLVSDGKFVVEADICDKIPLPGYEGNIGEKTLGEGQVVDVVVCALSLMGLNWLTCIREAWRILKPGGELQIAEVTSRFTDIQQFLDLVNSIGFRLKSKDESNSHFILFEFTKVARTAKTQQEWTQLLSRGGVLKPCEYKRR